MSNINYNLRYEVFGQSGFEPFRGIRKVKKPFYYKVTFDTGQELKLSEKHRLFLENGEEIYVKDLTEGTRVLGIDGDEILSTVLKVEKIEELSKKAAELAQREKYAEASILYERALFLSTENTPEYSHLRAKYTLCVRKVG